MKPESRLQRQIRQLLEERLGGFWFKVHGGPFQVGGLPDLIGCVQGVMIGIEVKLPGEHPTARQEWTMNKLREAGAIIMVAHSVEEVKDSLHWLIQEVEYRRGKDSCLSSGKARSSSISQSQRKTRGSGLKKPNTKVST